jgi:hypothetical protein
MVQSSTVFGGGFTPFLLQYNFSGRNASHRRFVPFVQAGAGMLFTTEDVPRDTAQFNFTPQGGIGVHWMHDFQSSLVFGLRYHHISNASRDRLNPGHNAIYFYTGLSWWR